MLETGEGPGGHVRSSTTLTRVSAWSRYSEVSEAVAFLNEEVVKGKRVIIDNKQASIYMHVDDGVVCAGGSGGKEQANEIMHFCADSLGSVGFTVDSRTQAELMEKVVGYAPVTTPARFTLPERKAVALQESLMFLTARSRVHTGELHSILGLWIWGALLRRGLLSIPYTIFTFITKLPNVWTEWWPVVKQEVIAMARVVPLMYCDLPPPCAACFLQQMLWVATVLTQEGMVLWGLTCPMC